MYHFIDQSPDRLTGGSHFLLWAMRSWVIAVVRERCPAASLVGAFSCKSMRETLSDFHELMFTLNHRGQRRMAFGDRGYGTITEIEAIFLSLWVDVAEGQQERARKVLDLLIVENKVAEVMSRFNRIVTHMSGVDLLPSRVLQPHDAS